MKQFIMRQRLTKSKLLPLTVVVVILLLAVLSVFWSRLSFIRDQFIAFAHIIAVVLLLLIAVLLGVLFWLLFRYLSTDKNNITVLPFDIAPGEDKLNGRAIADEFTAQCLDIKQALERHIDGIEPESIEFGQKVSPDKEELSRDLVNFATVGVGQTTVSIGQLIVALRRLWPGDGGTTFTGTLQRYEKAISLTMRVQEGTKVHAWEVSKVIEGESEIPGLVRDLAFKVLKGTDTARLESSGSSYVPGVDTKTKAEASESYAISAKTWEGLKHYAEARDAYYQFQLWGNEKRLEDARLAIVRAVTAEPDYVKTLSMLWSLGNEYVERGDSKAEEMFRHAIKAIELGAENEAIPRSDLLALLGWSLIKDGAVHNAPEAIQVLHKATESEPEFSFAWSNLGIAYDLLGNFEEATKAHNKAIEYYSKQGDDHIRWLGRAQGLMNSAYWLFAFGKYDDAMLRCKKAIEAIDENERGEPEPPHLYMSDFLTGGGRFTQALERCRQAAEVYGESAPILNRESFIHLILGNYDKADEISHKALQQEGDASGWSDAWYIIGQIRYCQHRYQEAISHYTKVRDLEPQSAVAHTSLASVYRRTDRADEFDKEVREARKMFGTGFDWPYSRACFEAVCGDLDEALKQLEIALQRKHVHPKWVHHDPDLDFIRDEKRYKDLMKRYKDEIVVSDTEPRPHKRTYLKIKGWWREVGDRAREVLQR